jgi:cellulose biosynthesis protein BcsQ
MLPLWALRTLLQSRRLTALQDDLFNKRNECFLASGIGWNVESMENGENKRASAPNVDDELAKDVARLYSWAHVEGVPYHDFSRQRKLHHAPPSPVVEDEKSSQQPELQQTGIVEPEIPKPEIREPEIRAKRATSQPAVPVPPLAEVQSSAAISPVHSEESPGQDYPFFPAQSSTLENMLTPYPFAVSKGRRRPTFVERGLLPHGDGGRPVMAVYSLAGGVGRTTLCANLGRVLCSMGEQVLLVDASGSGLLPFYFGASDLRPGLRTFVAPGMNYSPLRVIGADEVTAGWLKSDVESAMLASHRTIFDLGPASMSVRLEIFRMCTVILVPLLPDLNSILSVSRIEASLKNMQSKGGGIPSPYYIFNEFDPQDSMAQQARELVVRQCGERLLPLTIRHGTEVAEAIASRMTVADYAPESEVTHDYLEIALWLRKLAPAIHAASSPGRWSEQ